MEVPTYGSREKKYCLSHGPLCIVIPELNLIVLCFFVLFYFRLSRTILILVKMGKSAIT